MKAALEIVKKHLMLKLEKVPNFDVKLFPEFFWEQFTEALLVFEIDPKPVYKLVLGLELDSEITEKIISKIPVIFSKLVKELAEEYVQGNNSKEIDVLLRSKGDSFKTEVEFLYALNKAIQIAERKRLKEEITSFLKDRK